MSIAEALIGLVAPAECVGCGAEGGALCAGCALSEITDWGEHCWSCGRISAGGRTCRHCRRRGSPHCVWITTHYEGVAAALVKKYKFGQLRAAANSLAGLMSQTLLDFNLTDDIAKLNYLVVPVPSATSRVRQRSFDHAVTLASRLARKFNLKTANVLGRLGQSRQLGARREVRLKQMTGKFYVRRPELVKDRNILLIDDVITTGATLRAAVSGLRQAGARRIDALVFAKRL